ncbi:MAG TPA: HAD family hydrolase, partial [Ruminococcaceae bacterium]|nr:HAD family hydrolase [Oscillospiraceae bacterium]
GTLANTLKSIAYFSNAALRRFGYRSIPAETYRTIVGDGADVQVHRMLDLVAGKGAYSEQDFKKVREVYGALYGAEPTRLLEPYAGMAETVRALKRLGVKTAVLSNKPHAWVTAIIDFLFPRGSFDRCYGQQPGIPRKPSPAGALRIARELGVSPRECLYIGDTNTDMKTGAAAGMDTAGALWGFRDRRELQENHAVYILEKPEEIVRLAAGDGR